MPDFNQLFAQPSAGQDFYAATVPQFQSNMPAAANMLKLSPQELALYQRHLDNLTGPGGVDHPDGSRSTLYQSVQQHNGKFYNVPTVFDGKILTEKDQRSGIDVPNAEALRRIEQEGWDQIYPLTPSKGCSHATEQKEHIGSAYLTAGLPLCCLVAADATNPRYISGIVDLSLPVNFGCRTR